MKKSRYALILILASFAAELFAADIMTGIGALFLFPEESPLMAATAEFSISGTLFSTEDNALYAGLSGTAKLDPLAADLDFSGSGNLFFSRLWGLNVSGVKLSLEGGRSDFTGQQWLTGELSFPLTLNGDGLSFSLTPHLAYAPLEGGYLSAGAGSELSFALGELIVKPGFSFTSLWYDDGARLYETGPGLRLSWYPLFPLTTEVSTLFRYQSDSQETITDSALETKLLMILSPFEWLLLTAEVSISYPDSALPAAAFVESAFFVHRSGTQSLSIPLYYRYSADEIFNHEIGMSLRYFF